MKTIRVVLALALVGLLVPLANAQVCGLSAGEPACGLSAGGVAGAGCTACCVPRKVCRLVKTTKTITVICWGCKEKDICIPCRSTRGCSHEESVKCGDCGTCGTAQGACCVRWTDWIPGGARQRTVKELVKYEVTKEVPTYKWEIVEVCGCHGGSPCCRR